MDKDNQMQQKLKKLMNSKDMNLLDDFVKNYGVNSEINGASLLYWMVFVNHLSGVKRLLELGADPNFRNEMGTSCLSLACYFGFVEIAETLIRYGAKIDSDCFNRANHGWGGHVQQEILRVLQKHRRNNEDK